jgi:hypothetical protein
VSNKVIRTDIQIPAVKEEEEEEEEEEDKWCLLGYYAVWLL